MKNGFSQLVSKALSVDGKFVRVATAVGSCGFNTKAPAVVAYLNGVAIFGFESVHSTPDVPTFICVVVGQGYFVAATLDDALTEGIRKARSSMGNRNRLSITQVQTMAMTANPVPAIEAEPMLEAA